MTRYLEGGIDITGTPTEGLVPVVQADGSVAWASAGGGFTHLVENGDASVLVADWPFVVAPDTDNPFATSNFYADATGNAQSTLLNDNLLAYQVQVVGEDENRLQVWGDGSLHWSDGTNPADAHLSYTPGGALVIGDPTFATEAIRLHGGNGTVQAYAPAEQTEALSVYDLGGAGNYASFGVAGDGSLHWSNGTDPADTALNRNDSWGGGLVAMDGSGNGVVAGDPDGEYAQLSATVVTVTNAGGQMSVGGGEFGNTWPGGGVRLTSPDGLTTKLLTIDNAGAPVWT